MSDRASKTATVWMPSQMLSDAAPRAVQEFTAVDGKPWVRWWYPGFPDTGGAVPRQSFKAWVRRNGAKEISNEQP